MDVADAFGKAMEKGYSLKMLNQWPGLKKLREDARFQHLVQEFPNKPRN